MGSEKIKWPEDLQATNSPDYTYNELVINANLQDIWAWLIRATLWSSWYSNCKNLKFISDDTHDLRMGSVFTWRTFGVPVKTIVEDFEPMQRLAWRGTGLGASGYHAWILESHPEKNTCKVITEEVQNGAVPWLARWYIRWDLRHYHQKWLEGLARMAQNGSPP